MRQLSAWLPFYNINQTHRIVERNAVMFLLREYSFSSPAIVGRCIVIKFAWLEQLEQQESSLARMMLFIREAAVNNLTWFHTI